MITKLYTNPHRCRIVAADLRPGDILHWQDVCLAIETVHLQDIDVTVVADGLDVPVDLTFVAFELVDIEPR